MERTLKTSRANYILCSTFCLPFILFPAINFISTYNKNALGVSLITAIVYTFLLIAASHFEISVTKEAFIYRSLFRKEVKIPFSDIKSISFEVLNPEDGYSHKIVIETKGESFSFYPQPFNKDEIDWLLHDLLEKL